MSEQLMMRPWQNLEQLKNDNVATTNLTMVKLMALQEPARRIDVRIIHHGLFSCIDSLLKGGEPV
jgi:hypothetical protein